jgi:hypothetical protein
MSRTIVASAMAIALAITGCASDPTASDEYALLEQKLADAVQQASEIESELVEVTAQRDALPTQVTAAELVIAQGWDCSRRTRSLPPSAGPSLRSSHFAGYRRVLRHTVGDVEHQ